MMQGNAVGIPKAVRPVLRYRDISRAVAWLCEAFGFERRYVSLGDNGEVVYAELAFGNSVVILGSIGEGWLDRIMRQPDEVQGTETQICSLIIDGIDACYVKAKAANVDIIFDLADDDTANEGFACRDPEGHIWHLTRQEPNDLTKSVTEFFKAPYANLDKVKQLVMAAKQQLVTSGKGQPIALAAAVVITGIVLAALTSGDQSDVSTARSVAMQNEVKKFNALLTKERGLRQAAERAAAKDREQLNRTQQARVVAEQKVAATLKQLQEKRIQEKRMAERKSSEVLQQLEVERRSKEALERSRKEKVAKLAEETAAHRESLRRLKQLQSKLDHERKVKETLARLRSVEGTKLAEESAAHRKALQKLKVLETQIAEERKAKQALEKLRKEKETKLAAEDAAHRESLRKLEVLQTKLVEERKAKQALEQLRKEKEAKLAAEDAAHRESQQKLEALQAKLSQVRKAMEELEQIRTEKVAKLAAEDTAHRETWRKLKDVQTQLAFEKKARFAAEESIKKTKLDLLSERETKQELEQTLAELKKSLTVAAKKNLQANVNGKASTGEATNATSILQQAAVEKKNSGDRDSTSKLGKDDAKKKTAAVRRARKSKKLASKKTTKKTKEYAPSRRQVRTVQRELKRVGCLKGPVTGKWDDVSGYALGDFLDYKKMDASKKVRAGAVISALRSVRGKVCQ